ncbi:unnamed protein product, partial [Iphiclides podalirius]
MWVRRGARAMRRPVINCAPMLSPAAGHAAGCPLINSEEPLPSTPAPGLHAQPDAPPAHSPRFEGTQDRPLVPATRARVEYEGGIGAS